MSIINVFRLLILYSSSRSSRMLFLDDFLEMLDELPSELRDRCMEMRSIDEQVEAGLESNRMAIMEFFDVATNMPVNERQDRYQTLQKEYARVRQLAAEKVEMAERMTEMLEKYVQHLDKEKTHFKYELEADNPGVTENIEQRFSQYCEATIAMRKERKRKHVNGSVNGENGRANGLLDLCLSQEIKLELGLTDDEVCSNGAMTPTSSGRGRRPFLDESGTPMQNKRPSLTSAHIRNSLSVPSGMNGLSISPAVSEKGWAPTFDQISPSSVTNSPYIPFAQTSMSSFVEPESRHGRPRKLTSKVQEMFTEAAQRQRHRHHPPQVHRPAGPNEEDDGEDSDDAAKSWCFCGESSYGDMIFCDNKECKIQWFHYGCVGISATPKGAWICPQCVNAAKARQSSNEPMSEIGEPIN